MLTTVCDTYVHLDQPQECWLCKGKGTGYDEDGRYMACHGERVTWPGQSICMRDPGHEGAHLTYVALPCPSCFAMEIHADWCPDMGHTTSEGVDLAFTDDGTYWVTVPSAVNVGDAGAHDVTH